MRRERSSSFPFPTAREKSLSSRNWAAALFDRFPPKSRHVRMNARSYSSRWNCALRGTLAATLGQTSTRKPASVHHRQHRPYLSSALKRSLDGPGFSPRAQPSASTLRLVRRRAPRRDLPPGSGPPSRTRASSMASGNRAGGMVPRSISGLARGTRSAQTVFFFFPFFCPVRPAPMAQNLDRPTFNSRLPRPSSRGPMTRSGNPAAIASKRASRSSSCRSPVQRAPFTSSLIPLQWNTCPGSSSRINLATVPSRPTPTINKRTRESRIVGSACPHQPGQRRQALRARQITSPVRWMESDAVTCFLAPATNPVFKEAGGAGTTFAELLRQKYQELEPSFDESCHKWQPGQTATKKKKKKKKRLPPLLPSPPRG